MALKTATDRQKRTPANDRDTMRAKAERVLMADVSQTDINQINWAKKQLQNPNAQMMRDLEGGGLILSEGEHGITDPEIEKVISGEIKKPTGIHKKK